jgi:phosphocarrier protein HPr
VQTVRKFKSHVQFICRGATINAGNILELMTLGATQGTALLLRAQGPDAEAVLDAIQLELAKTYD